VSIAIFSCKAYEKPLLKAAHARLCPQQDPPTFLEAKLSLATVGLARGMRAVSIFVGDDASAPVLRALAQGGTSLLALRSAGFNHVDIASAETLGITVARVPAYSPYSVAEHAIALMLTLNRKLHRAHARVREQNFSLDGLMGFDMHGKVAGIVGTGKIGEAACSILRGFGCQVLAFDPSPSPACLAMGARYTSLDDLYAQCDIISLHCPLTPSTHHLISDDALAKLKPGVMLINTCRGGVIDTRALIRALKRGHVGSVGLDVYEEEGDLFFSDLSNTVVQDDVFVRLQTFPNVLITAHQGFFTREACEAIATTTIENAAGFSTHGPAGIAPERRVTRLLIAC
jgi:D-lactate dehydrogenase